MYRFIPRPLAYALLRGSLEDLPSRAVLTVLAVKIAPPGYCTAGLGGTAALRKVSLALQVELARLEMCRCPCSGSHPGTSTLQDAVWVCQEKVGNVGGYVGTVHVDARGAWLVAVFGAGRRGGGGRGGGGRGAADGAQRALGAAVRLQVE